MMAQLLWISHSGIEQIFNLVRLGLMLFGRRSCCEYRVGNCTPSPPMGSKSVVDLIEASSGVHYSGFHLDGLEPRNTEVDQPSTSAAESVHKQPFVIGLLWDSGVGDMPLKEKLSRTRLFGKNMERMGAGGVAGGAASGKTTVCDMIIEQLHDQRVVLVNQDSFYNNLTEEELARVHEYNFDHPDAFDTEQLLCAMEKLKHGQAVDIPKYDFKSYKNNVFPARRVNPSDVIILEGILIFHDLRVRELMNMKIFVDTDADVRLARRIRRDTVEKGRDIGMVLDQISQPPVAWLLWLMTFSLFGARWVKAMGDVKDMEHFSIMCNVVKKLRETKQKGLGGVGYVMIKEYSKFVKPAFDDFILPTKKYADIIIPRGGDNHVAIDLIVQHIRTKLGQHDLCKIYPNLYVIQSTFQIRGMHTLIRDAQTTKHDFVFYADRLIRLVVEHGLGHLPFTEKQVITPTESVYSGVDFCKRLCGVSVIRRKKKCKKHIPGYGPIFSLSFAFWFEPSSLTDASGESMENALRACCKGIKIGKILIHREGDNGQQLIYEKLPKDISDRHVLLLDPVLGTGNSAVQAISLLIQKGVPESNIIFLNLISAPQGVHVVCKSFPRIKIVTSEIDVGLNEDFRVIPGMGEFGDRYFGTDDDDQQLVAPPL
uniref:Uncharacterized protein n=1 Tax=Vitis vinifera TaxID=29760 RepID=A5BX44_VITVI|nr:hypothetical protein VITISV_008796 [Vitis vinifera]